MMTLPNAIQQMVEEALAHVRQDASHQLPLLLRRQIYDAFRALRQGERALDWLEILTIRFVLPRWSEEKLGHSWDDYPTPAQLVRIREDRLRGLPISDDDDHATRLAAEMVSLTGEDRSSPIYPTWCVFEAAVRSSQLPSFHPDEHPVDTAPDEGSDVAYLAMIAYAGHIETENDDLSELLSIWHEAEYDITMSRLHPEHGIKPASLPWTLTLDASACLQFWEWWLLKALPEAWQWANENPDKVDHED